LYMRINKNPNIAEALGEPKQITDRRNTLNALKETLDNSIKVLTRDPEITAAHHDDSGLADDIRADQMARKRAAEEAKNNPRPNPGPPGPGPNPNPNPSPGPNPRVQPPGPGPNPNVRPPNPANPLGPGGQPGTGTLFSGGGQPVRR